jgi:hypothetical protein
MLDHEPNALHPLIIIRSSIRVNNHGPVNPNTKIIRHHIRKKSPAAILSLRLYQAIALRTPPTTMTAAKPRINERTLSFAHKLLKARMVTKGIPTINSPTLCWTTPSISNDLKPDAFATSKTTRTNSAIIHPNATTPTAVITQKEKMRLFIGTAENMRSRCLRKVAKRRKDI